MICLSSPSAQHYIAIMERQGGITQTTARSRRSRLPEQLGTGWFEHFDLQPGFELSIIKYDLSCDVPLHVQVDSPLISFGCIVHGSISVQSAGQHQAARSGQALTMLASKTDCDILVVKDRYRALSIEVSPRFLLERAGLSSVPEALEIEPLLSQANFPTLLQVQPLSALSHSAAIALLSSSIDDSFRSLLLESHALTILREQLLGLQPAKVTAKQSFLGRRDIDGVEEVRRVLLNDPKNSPSLFILSKHVSMNEYSLKKGFRMRFGVTVYEFLRDHRLNTAEALLRTGDLTVGEVAAAVGYQSQGRFAIAFRKHFGVSPKKHQLTTRAKGL